MGYDFLVLGPWLARWSCEQPPFVAIPSMFLGSVNHGSTIADFCLWHNRAHALSEFSIRLYISGGQVRNCRLLKVHVVVCLCTSLSREFEVFSLRVCHTAV